jgi:uncharacterized protein (DUF1499 family)
MVKAIRVTALCLAIGALVLLAASGPGTRYGAWDYRVGILVFVLAGVLAIVAALTSAVTLAVPRLRQPGIAGPAFALLLGLAVFYVPLHAAKRSRSVPPINDISTDTANPPQYMTTQRAYGGPEFERQQKQAYPDLAPLALTMAPREAFAKAVKAAESMGWEVVGRDADKGMIEAVDTSSWFGFKDDIAIRVRPAPDASPSRSIVDVRSKSRVGRGDQGTNARRIRAYLERLK